MKILTSKPSDGPERSWKQVRDLKLVLRLWAGLWKSIWQTTFLTFLTFLKILY